MDNRTTIQVSDATRKKLRVLASQRDCSYQDLLEDMLQVFSEIDHNKTIVSLPKKLTEKIRTNIENTDFSSISEYLTFLLRQLLVETEGAKISSKDEAKIKEKLEKLGYL